MLLQPNHNKFGQYKEKAGLKLLPPQKGLICDLDMEKIVGTTVYDRTGNGYNGTLIGDASTSIGIEDLNKSVLKTTTGSGASIPQPMLPKEAYEFWFYYGAIHDGYLLRATSNPRTNIQFYNDGTYPRSIWISITAPSGNYLNAIYSNNFFTVGEWHHIIFQWDGSVDADVVQLWKNGKLILTGTASQQRTVTSSSQTYYFNDNTGTGEIRTATFRKWDRILTEKEIKYLYNNGYGIK